MAAASEQARKRPADGSTPPSTKDEKVHAGERQAPPSRAASIIKTTQPAKQGLPFTGMNLVTFFVLGGVLLAAGLFLRLLGRRRTGA